MGCTSSKYAAGEDKVKLEGAKPEKNGNSLMKKLKISKKDKSKNGKVESGENGKLENGEAQHGADQAAPKDEHIEFIDNDAEKREENDDSKKEVTTYQTTVVKHTQKEGDELMTHLREEAFRTLQNSLKQAQQANGSGEVVTKTTLNASVDSNNAETSTSSSDEDLVKQIKDQVVVAIGSNKSEQIHSIIEQGANLIREGKVKSMNELQTELEKLNPNEDNDSANSELVKKVINATTGFLTAKGTEAGALLSTILANANAGLQGVLNETEKTTVKVTRTVTEQVMSGGQLKEITKVITTNEPLGPGQNIQDIIRNLSAGATVTTTGTTSTTTNTQVNEKHENVPSSQDEKELVDRAEKVVNTVVTNAVEIVQDENNKHANQNGHHTETEITTVTNDGVHETTENIKIEEESSVKVSTTKIVLNGENGTSTESENGVAENGDLDNVQTDFYKHGKHEAETLVKKLSQEVLNEETAE